MSALGIYRSLKRHPLSLAFLSLILMAVGAIEISKDLSDLLNAPSEITLQSGAFYIAGIVGLTMAVVGLLGNLRRLLRRRVMTSLMTFGAGLGLALAAPAVVYLPFVLTPRFPILAIYGMAFSTLFFVLSILCFHDAFVGHRRQEKSTKLPLFEYADEKDRVEEERRQKEKRLQDIGEEIAHLEQLKKDGYFRRGRSRPWIHEV